MKKILHSLVLFFVFFGAAVPVKAAPFLDPPEEDADWICTLSGDTFYPSQTGDGCPSPNDPVSPYTDDGVFSFGGPAWIAWAKVSCSPYPSCLSGMYVYYFVTADVTWTSDPGFGSTFVEFKMDVTIAGGGASVNTDWVPCGTGLSGSCSATLSGILPLTNDVRASSTNRKTPDTVFYSFNITYTAYYSLLPYDFCEDQYTTLDPFTYTIDPVIELPLGPVGSPPDDQIFPTETDQIYRVELSGAGWNDGTDPRDDAAISWDGETWEELTTGECSAMGAGGEFQIFYIIAESETFYIRANDIEDEFEDNTQVDEEDPFVYSIALAIPFTSCESQFSYDQEDDLLSEVVVEGDDTDGIQATGTTGFTPIPEMVPTEWYAIEVTSGTWQDEGAAPDRIDMEFQVTTNLGFDVANYADLGTGGDGVWCQSTDLSIWFIQARSTDLYLRVNNVTSTFAANTGELNVSIYHASFERTLEACEYNYDEFEAPSRMEVSGTSANGKRFAYVGGADDPFAGLSGGAGAGDDPFAVESDSWSTTRLIPGAWYIIETIDGPWMENSSLPNDYRYDMAVNDGDGWIELEDWTVPVCNVASDALGHRRIYFQVPTGEALEWSFRVDSTTFTNNGGYLAWNIYRALEVDFENPAFNPWAGCIDNAQNSYDVLAFNSLIPVKMEEGTYVKGNINTGVGANGVTTTVNDAAILETGGTYVIQIFGGPWDDDDSDQVLGVRYDAAVSSDNGVTWNAIDTDTPGAECLSDDQQGRYFMYKFTVVAEQIWKIRVNDEAGDFANNGGSLSYHLYRIRNFYGAESGAGANPTNLCTGGIPTPAPPTSVIDVPAWLGYVAGWVKYSAMTIRRFFSLCPQHINSIMVVLERMRTREPIATVVEALSVIEDIKIEIASYDWDGNPQSTSIFDIDSASDLNEIVNNRIFPTGSEARSPWEGGDIIDPSDFNGGWAPGSYYYTCLAAFDGYLPTVIAQGVCFVSAAFRDTGASFWIQLSFDVSCIFMMVAVTKRPIQEVIYMMTGVRPWTKSGAESGLNKLIGYLERRDGTVDRDAEELANQFGGSFSRNRDGSFRRRQ